MSEESYSATLARMNARLIRRLGRDVAVVRAKSVTGIFKASGIDQIVGDITVKGIDPSFACMISDLPDGTVVNDRIRVNDRDYSILEFTPPRGDESGWVVMRLGK